MTRIVSADRADKLEKYCSRIKDLRGAQVIECEVITNQFIHRETKLSIQCTHFYNLHHLTRLDIAKPDAKKPQMAAIDVYKKLIYLSSSCDPKRGTSLICLLISLSSTRSRPLSSSSPSSNVPLNIECSRFGARGEAQ